MTKQADLIAYVFDGQQRRLSVELMQWMESSPRYTAFVDTYRDKIRKKIRLAQDPETLLDLRSELEVAFCLLNDRRLVVAYEPYASVKRRGPDFAVTYRVNLVFNIEVARLRAEAHGTDAVDLLRKKERILGILLDKLGQMQPGMPNLMVIHTLEDMRRSVDLDDLMQAVKTMADRKDSIFYTASRYTSPAAFYKDFLRLSGILLWSSVVQLWANKQAKPALEEKALRLVSSLLSTQQPSDQKR